MSKRRRKTSELLRNWIVVIISLLELTEFVDTFFL